MCSNYVVKIACWYFMKSFYLLCAFGKSKNQMEGMFFESFQKLQ